MINPNFFTKKEEDNLTQGRFILEPLPYGFGNSMGNALRRTLLASLKGAAITQVKIAKASHLFTTLKGVKESILDIVLRMKQLRFQTPSDGSFKISLNSVKQGKIYGKDIEGEAKVINGDLYIAEITDEKAKLEIEAMVETGVGYLAAEEKESKEFGFISVDAFFSPVKKVNFKVEEARVGRKTNFDRLVLDITTDGSTKPSEALKEASLILSDFFKYILSGQDQLQERTEKTQEEVQKEEVNKRLNEIIIDELDLPSRVINALLRENIETVAELVKVGRDKLATYKGVGKKSVTLIEEELSKLGVKLD